MKNANIFVDVDLTLIDANGKLLTGVLEALVKLKDKGAICSFGQQTAPNTRRRSPRPTD